MLRILLLSVFVLAAVTGAWAQGATTSAMNGKVTDQNGEPLPGATVVAVHTPSGTQYGNTTDAKGFYRIPNMRVGGPYTITVNFIGYAEFKKEGVSLALGQVFNLNAQLSESVETLGEVVIKATGSEIINPERTGAKTSISKEQIERMPNANRDINDFARLTPQASFTSGGGLSIAGMNNRYNAIFVDGAVSNDVMGLAANGQNGGQVAGLSLMSIDALEQISVAVAPYDVTLGGFAGGGISAVTRSGSNEVEGSVYYLVRNERLAGKTPTFISESNRKRLADFSARTYGFRIGGPIIKDKLFFFVNAETKRDETPQPFDFVNYRGAATKAQVDAFSDKLKELGYDPGAYENTISELEASRFLIKLDYNISNKHKVSIRHSYNKGESISPATSNTNRIRFANAGIAFPSTTNSTTFELQSNFDDKSNKLIIGYNHVVDDRDPIGNDFPYIIIQTGDVQAGSEEFSTANYLEQKVITITDNFNLFKGNHTFTFGTHNEFYNMNNVFVRQNFGSYRYATINDFIADVDNGTTTGAANQYNRSYSLVDDVTGDGTAAAAKFKAMQLGFYAQDEWQVTPKLKLTMGLRIDIPIFTEDPKVDTTFNNQTVDLIETEGYVDLKGARSGQAPDAQLMFAPRVGFNYDVFGNQQTQIRGGFGIFTSRVPFVWPGAMYNQNGSTVGGTSQTSGISFLADPYNQPTVGDFGGSDAIPQGELNLFTKDFKFPQVMRGSIAVDQQLPFWGLIAGVEFIYSKTLNNVFYENANLKAPTVQFDGTPDDRYRFTNGRVDNRYQGNIYLGSNTSEGHTASFTVSLTKPFANGFTAMAAYNYGTAQAIFEGTSSQNSSQWRGVYAINGRNSAPVGRSDFDAGHRIVASVSYRKEYLENKLATTVGLFYEGQSGNPYSYTYNTGLTGEDSRERALIYVPKDETEIVLLDIAGGATAAEQWAALDKFIENDEYLKTRRGKYAEKNEARTPFTNILDLKILQDIYFESAKGKRHNLQVSFDIFNFTNMLNKDWGKRYAVPNGDGTSVQLLNFVDFAPATNTPRFRYAAMADKKEDLLTKDDAGIVSSRWQMQLGVRYTF